MAYKNFPNVQASKAFAITASDTVDVKDDAANLDDVPFVYLHNVAASCTCRVLPAGQPKSSGSEVPVTIYLTQGQVFPMAVRRVFATTPTPPAGLLGLYW